MPTYSKLMPGMPAVFWSCSMSNFSKLFRSLPGVFATWAGLSGLSCELNHSVCSRCAFAYSAALNSMA
eukprot:5566593-Pyramimonas_sp.AAC.1